MSDKYLSNADWVQRIQGAFENIDATKNGYLEREDWELWVNNIAKAPNSDPALVAKLRQRMYEYCDALGLTPGKRSTRDEFVKDFAKFAAAERLRKERGEATLTSKLNEAWYDVVDTNHDGNVTLEEYRAIFKACNFDPGRADAVFEVIDKDKNGKIERSELGDFEYKFWFGLGE